MTVSSLLPSSSPDAQDTVQTAAGTVSADAGNATATAGNVAGDATGGVTGEGAGVYAPGGISLGDGAANAGGSAGVAVGGASGSSTDGSSSGGSSATTGGATTTGGSTTGATTTDGSTTGGSTGTASGTASAGATATATSSTAADVAAAIAGLGPCVTLHGSSDQYSVAVAKDGALTVTDGVSGRDGAQTLAAGTNLAFTDGAGLADASGVAGDVTRLYQAAFDRTPDLGGLAYWVKEAATDHVPLATIAAAFAGTKEFASDYGSLDDAGCVGHLYQNVLHRAGDAGGLAYWEHALQSGTSRGAVLQSFAESAENQANLIASTGSKAYGEAYRLYQAAFDRTPDATGLAYWTNALTQGASAGQVAADFAASAEFKTMAGDASNASAFVSDLYQHVLGRAGDTAGVQYWTQALAGGASQANVLLNFADSAENMANTATATHAGWVCVKV